MTVAFAVNMALLTLAVMALTIRTLYYASSSNPNTGVSMPIPITQNHGQHHAHQHQDQGEQLDHVANTDPLD